MAEDFVIDETNFGQYFRELNKDIPQKGDVLSVYRAMAELLSGDIKKDIVNLLKTEMEVGAKQAIQIAVKLCKTNEKEAIKLVKEICTDLHDGKSEDYIMDKPYQYMVEIFYFTKPEYVPNDKHWSFISIKNIDEFIEKTYGENDNIIDERFE